jgi:hypothetical protein
MLNPDSIAFGSVPQHLPQQSSFDRRGKGETLSDEHLCLAALRGSGMTAAPDETTRGERYSIVVHRTRSPSPSKRKGTPVK